MVSLPSTLYEGEFSISLASGTYNFSLFAQCFSSYPCIPEKCSSTATGTINAGLNNYYCCCCFNIYPNLRRCVPAALMRRAFCCILLWFESR